MVTAGREGEAQPEVSPSRRIRPTVTTPRLRTMAPPQRLTTNVQCSHGRPARSVDLPWRRCRWEVRRLSAQVTVKGRAETTTPESAVTEMEPVTAPWGTVTATLVAERDTIR